MLPVKEPVVIDSEQIKQIKIRELQKKWAGRLGLLIVLMILVYAVGQYNIMICGNALPVGQVAGSSMEPTYYPGEWVVYYTPDKKPVEVGSVIVYSKAISKKLVVHRVISIEPDGSYITKGDNNLASDQLLGIDSRNVRPEDIIGVVSGRLYNGWENNTYYIDNLEL